MNRVMLGVCAMLIAAVIPRLLAAADSSSDAGGGGTGRVTQSFDADPQWDGHRNRLLPNPAPVVEQRFGFSPTHHAGTKAGEVGGRVQRSVTPAWYARKIPTKTLDDKLTASGKFAVTGADGSSGVMFGWFNDKSRGWRTPNSLVVRLDGNGGKYWVFIDYCTRHWLAGGKGAFEGEANQRTPTKPFPADGTVHEWSLTYDPKGGAGGKGAITLTLDGKTWSIDIPAANRADGAEFNRFGILNAMTGGNSLEMYLDDVTLDGRKLTFDEDPAWEGNGNQTRFEEKIVRPFHDFGYSPTQLAGGSNKGELGGVIWRDETPAYYAAKTDNLTLDDELFASGTLAFTGAGSDSGVYLGWFDSRSRQNQSRPQHEVPPNNTMALMIEGPSRIGHYFRPAFWNAKGNGGIVDEGPIIRPDGKPHTWSMHYSPRGADGRGRITWKLDDVERSFDLKDGVRDGGATFDRFGLLDVQSGGHYVFLYIDDLTYTAAPAKR